MRSVGYCQAVGEPHRLKVAGEAIGRWLNSPNGGMNRDWEVKEYGSLSTALR